MHESDEAYEHLQKTGGRRFRSALRDLAVLGRMAKAVSKGDYELALPKVALMFGTFGYVVSPIDLVPEAVLGPFGLSDDVAAISFAVGALALEIACFLEWEADQSGETPAAS